MVLPLAPHRGYAVPAKMGRLHRKHQPCNETISQYHAFRKIKQVTVLSRMGTFVEIGNNTLYGSKISIFLLYTFSHFCHFMPKLIRILRPGSMKIFCKSLTVNISKPHL